MVIVEYGKGTDPAANSYAELRSFQFHGDYYRFPIPSTEVEQIEYLLRAAKEMDGMRWKGERTSQHQPLAWPRNGINIAGEFLSKTLIPYGIYHGQVMLAVELYAADQGIELREPTHAYDRGKMIPLDRSSEKVRTHPPLWVASRTQFADYLVMRGLSIVR